MKYILAVWNCNWADEFDTEGFLVITDENWNKFVEALTDKDCKQEFYFGTNEALEFEDKNDYLRHFEVKEISAEEAETITKHLGKQYGTIALPYYKECILWGRVPKEEDDEDDL